MIVEKFVIDNMPLLTVIPYLAFFDFQIDSILFRNSQTSNISPKKKKKSMHMFTTFRYLHSNPFLWGEKSLKTCNHMASYQKASMHYLQETSGKDLMLNNVCICAAASLQVGEQIVLASISRTGHSYKHNMINS